MTTSNRILEPTSTPAPVPKRRSRPARLQIESFGLTDCGQVRTANEDQFVTATLARALVVQQSSVAQAGVQYADDRGSLFIVADGVGGAPAGAKASAMAVGAVEDFLLNALRWMFSLEGGANTAVMRELKAALRNADERVYAAATANEHDRGMGTTLTMAFSRGNDLFIAHAGDSRCYLMRNGTLSRLTHDDTLTNELVEGGVLPAAEAANNGFRNIITNFIGSPPPGVHATVQRFEVRSGDVLLLCSDGLSGVLNDETMMRVVSNSASPEQACRELIRGANELGGPDNITAIVARYWS